VTEPPETGDGIENSRVRLRSGGNLFPSFVAAACLLRRRLAVREGALVIRRTGLRRWRGAVLQAGCVGGRTKPLSSEFTVSLISLGNQMHGHGLVLDRSIVLVPCTSGFMFVFLSGLCICLC
jgi:hypothetical protein